MARSDLQDVLENVLESPNVYFQPPPTINLSYPAIVYRLDGIAVAHANNGPYKTSRRYTVTLITKDPDSPIVGGLALLPKCKFDRYYVSPGLHNYVFSIYKE